MIGKIGGQRNEIKLVPGKGSVSEKPKCNGVSVEKKIVAALNYAARFDESNFERW